MKRFFKTLRLDLHRAICSPGMILTILLMLAWMALNGNSYLFDSQWQNIMGSAEILQHVTAPESGFGALILAIATIPYATGYLQDLESGFARQIIARVGCHSYGLAKIIAAALSAFLAMCVSMGIFLIAVHMAGWRGMFTTDNLFTGDYLGLQPAWHFYLIRFLHMGLYCSMAAVLSMAVSAYIPNGYVVLLAPMVLLYYFWNTLIVIFSLDIPLIPSWIVSPLSIRLNISGKIFPHPYFSAAWTVVFFLTITVLCGFFFMKKIKKEQNI